jgi:hypothetical protein
MKTRHSTNVIVASLALICNVGAPSFAADKTSPDWPCIQKKVESLSPGSIWDGPPIDADMDASSDESIKEVVLKLTSRRVPIEQATIAVKAYAESVDAAKKDAALTHLFASVFGTINGQRKTVMAGLEKYLRSQRDRSASVEQMGLDLEKLRETSGTDDESEAKLAKAQQEYDWASRIFQERQQNITVACDVPVLLDQRLGEVARTIREVMSK